MSDYTERMSVLLFRPRRFTRGSAKRGIGKEKEGGYRRAAVTCEKMGREKDPTV